MRNFKLTPANDEKMELIRQLKNTFDKEKPLAKMIMTDTGGYLYDTGTNKILGCTPEVFKLLNNLFARNTVNAVVEDFIAEHSEEEFLQTAREIISAMNSENVLKTPKATQFGLSDHFNNIEELLNTSIMSVNLEVTEACNLRCKYCVYHDHVDLHRGYTDKSMSLETAQKAIRFLERHSSNTESPAIAFYGGEPLLRFPFIKDCVQYAREIFRDREVIFTMTTNAVLITPQIAEFLLQEGFLVVVSLDGPAEYHDMYRKKKDGNGSFDEALQGLKILADKHREIKRGNISINAVYTPPYSAEKLNAINNFINQLEWLPEINVNINYPTKGSIPPDMIPETGREEDKSISKWAVGEYRSHYRESDRMVRSIVDLPFARLMQRPVFAQPEDRYFLNGCCVPGHRKCYITVDGNIQVCEKMPANAPAIGHVDTGFDLKTIKEFYIREYAAKSLKDCAGCWGSRMCQLCYYMALNSNGEFDLQRKRTSCATTLRGIEKNLEEFVTLLRENPGKLDYLYQHEIT